VEKLPTTVYCETALSGLFQLLVLCTY
jgi:hypothetical protein